MHRIIKSDAHLSGVCESIREEGTFFSEFESCETKGIPETMPDVGQIASIITDSEIISIKVVNTPKGKSSEGMYLTGKKVAIHMQLKQKILYAANVHGQTIHTFENEIYMSTYIGVPNLIKGTDPEVLIKYKHLRADIIIEDVLVKKVNSRTILSNISILAKLCIVPTYELCYSLHQNSKTSNTYLCCEDGQKNIQITPYDGFKYFKPMWATSGQEIALLSGEGDKYTIYLFDLRNSEFKRLLDPSEFKSIRSCCWSADGLNIIFSSSVGGYRELFKVDTNNLRWKQLTFGNSRLHSYKPRCSAAGDKLAFLKSVSGISYIYIMGIDGLNCKKAADLTGVKDLFWSNNGRFIVCIVCKTGRSDELWLIDFVESTERLLSTPELIVHKNKVKFSADGNFISFIGSDLHTEDVFIYDIKNESTRNVTNSYESGKISDYTWDADSGKIFYCSNELYYHNIYLIDVKNGGRQQITNSTASQIELSYRPKIR